MDKKITIEFPSYSGRPTEFAKIWFYEENKEEINMAVSAPSVMKELRDSLKGMLESYELMINDLGKNDLLAGALKGYFIGEINRARELLKED
jgi:hypothetical protein